MPDRDGDTSQCERLTQGRKIAISSGGAFLTTPQLWRLASLVALVGLPGAHSGGHIDSRQDPNSGRRECLQSALRKALAYDLNPELVTPHFFSFMLLHAATSIVLTTTTIFSRTNMRFSHFAVTQVLRGAASTRVRIRFFVTSTFIQCLSLLGTH